MEQVIANGGAARVDDQRVDSLKERALGETAVGVRKRLSIRRFAWLAGVKRVTLYSREQKGTTARTRKRTRKGELGVVHGGRV